MYKYKYLLFDMDGTITDSYDAVTRSFIYALEYYGIKVKEGERLDFILGPPLRQSFENHYGFTPEKAVEATEKYRERYQKYFLKEHKIFDGVKNLLSDLNKCGFKNILATSKPEVSARKILEHFNLNKYFYYISGASLDSSRDTKEKVLEHIFDELKIPDKSKAIMIGDRKYDMMGAKHMNIDALGVTYGYGTRQELEAYNPVYIADNCKQIYDFLTKK